MVHPVTGPVWEGRTNNRDGAGSYRVDRKRYKQAPPYNLVLDYYSVHKKVLSADGVARVDGKLVERYGNANANASYGPWQTFTFAADSGTPEVIEAVQKARERFSGSLREQAQVLVDLAERESTKQMVASKLVTLHNAYRSFRKGNFNDARKALGQKRLKPPKTDWRKKPGEAWLEWHFGWAPLYGGIHAGMEILTSPHPVLTAVGRGSFTKYWRYDEGRYRCGHTCSAKATIKADIYIENKNLWMANQLGLLNPASVAWELVPFSFLVDWVSNVGDFLAQYNEFSGLTISRPCTSWKFVVTSNCHYEEWYNPQTLVRRWTTVSQAVSSERKPDIPSVKLSFRMPDRLSWQRGLTAAALMTGLLKRG